MKNAPKTLSTGVKEGICTGEGMGLEEGLRIANSQCGKEIAEANQQTQSAIVDGD